MLIAVQVSMGVVPIGHAPALPFTVDPEGSE